MANLYFDETLHRASCEIGALVEVSGDEAHHAVRVSRLRVGEQILVGDGRGTMVGGPVVETAKDRFVLRVASVRRDPEPDQHLSLVQALAKGDRDERAVEQATEFGVDEIWPWESARTVSRWGDTKSVRGVAKWQRIAREAAKQSVRSRVPAVREPTSLGALCDLAGETDNAVLVLHPRGESALSDWARAGDARDAKRLAVVVGPEGGLGESELDALAAAGAHILRLGDTVLRTSSAGPAALAVLNAALGRW